MLPKITPTTTTAWKNLETHFDEIKSIHLRDLFALDKDRFNKFSTEFSPFFLDYSKNLITEKTMKLLIDLANECQLKEAISAQFAGESINETENRAVLHSALRAQSDKGLIIENENVYEEVQDVLQQMENFSEKVISGEWKGFSGKEITDVVNIGIGGSDLGPVMVTEALKSYSTRLKVHFVSNIDGTHLVETLQNLNAETTLFIIASKTFTTQETMTNADSAKDWFFKNGGTQKDVASNFVALSTNRNGVVEFGISEENMFRFWNWVGGRYSLWGAIGLSICLFIGFKNFKDLLLGAAEMDEHFRSAHFDKNLPVILGLIGIWYNNFFQSETLAILPYEQSLHRFAAYLQQGDMESNGKSVDRNGNKINYQTGPIIWGEAGTNGQHAFYQLIHQGSKLIPADFIAGAKSNNPMGDHHQKLLANYFAQTEALAFGKNRSDVEKEFVNSTLSKEVIDWMIAFKVFEGNHPTNSILYEILNPKTLGGLIAMYEQKIFVQGIIWNVYSFDQYGVELGKQLANKILPELENEQEINTHDSSTNGLINRYKKMRN